MIVEARKQSLQRQVHLANEQSKGGVYTNKDDLSTPRPSKFDRPSTLHKFEPNTPDPDTGDTQPLRGVDLPLNLATNENKGQLDGYRAPVSGKVVLGTPKPEKRQEASSDDPHAMLPIPGQAPSKPIVVVFDGGSRGNPGNGYGSYMMRWPGAQEQIVRLQFGNHMTNNEAEYDTLIAALEAALKRLADQKADPKTASIIIFGDSQLVINQVKNKWQCKKKELKLRRDHIQSLLREFGQWRLRHQPREKSVDVLGH